MTSTFYFAPSSKVWYTMYVFIKNQSINSWAVSKQTMNMELKTDISRNVRFQWYHTYRRKVVKLENNKSYGKGKSMVVISKSLVRGWRKNKLDINVLQWMVGLFIDGHTNTHTHTYICNTYSTVGGSLLVLADRGWGCSPQAAIQLEMSVPEAKRIPIATSLPYYKQYNI